MLKSLSVVILAYNEEENVAQSINQVYSVLKKIQIPDFEILLINDGSKDRTGEIAQSLTKKIPQLRVITNNPNRGYGGALKTGLRAAGKEFVAITHADNQFDFSEISLLINRQIETNADLVCGVRKSGGVDPLHRKFNRWGWNTIVRAFFGYLATDVDCGFKLYRRDIIPSINAPAERGAMIDTQILAGVRARGYKVVEVPVTHLPRTAGKSTGANPRVIVQSFIDLFTFWLQLKKEIMVERGLAVFPWEMLLLLAILALGAFSRLYQISGYMTFLGDEGRDARIMRDIVTFKNLPLLGPGTSIGSMYLGPLYYYLTAPSLALFNFNPVGPAIQTALIGVVTIGLLWWVGRQWFGRPAAIFTSLLMAISPVAIIYSRSSWNPNVMPFFSLLVIYSVWKIWRFSYWRWLPIGAVSLIFALNSHYLALLLLPPALFFVSISKKTADTKRNFFVSVLVAAFLLSPLVIFDLKYNFSNFSAISKFFTQRESTISFRPSKAFNQLLPTLEKITSSVLVAKNSDVARFLAPFMIFSLLLLAASDPKYRRDGFFLLLWLAVGLVGLSLYKQHIYDHYFGFLFPVIFWLLGFCYACWARHQRVRPALFFLLTFMVYLNLSQHPLLVPPNNQLQKTQTVANDILARSQGKPFNLALLSQSNYDESYRYFLENSGAPLYSIHDRLTEQLFVICEQPQCDPVGNKLWEIAAFGWAKIQAEWHYPWGVRGYKLVKNTP